MKVFSGWCCFLRRTNACRQQEWRVLYGWSTWQWTRQQHWRFRASWSRQFDWRVGPSVAICSGDLAMHYSRWAEAQRLGQQGRAAGYVHYAKTIDDIAGLRQSHWRHTFSLNSCFFLLWFRVHFKKFLNFQICLLQ